MTALFCDLYQPSIYSQLFCNNYTAVLIICFHITLQVIDLINDITGPFVLFYAGNNENEELSSVLTALIRSVYCPLTPLPEFSAYPATTRAGLFFQPAAGNQCPADSPASSL